MSEIRINSINIKNYRSFGEQQDFVFPNKDYKKPVAIVGYNNSGKTNLMNCILYGIGYKFVQERTFEKNDLHNLEYRNQIKIKVYLEGSEFDCQQYYDSKNKSNRNTKSISGIYEINTEIDCDELKSKMSPSMFGMNKHYNIFYINFHNIKEEISTKKTSWGNLTSFLAKHIKGIVESDSLMASKQGIYEVEVKAATEKVLKDSKLSEFISKIKDNYSTNLRDSNCQVSFGLPDYEDIFQQMIFKIGLNDDTNLIPIDHFGDGYISMFVMAVIQAIAESQTEDKCLFLFEEPESFLHENHQEYFYKMVLCNLSERGHQVIYTTHSDKMVDIFDTKGIIRIEYDEINKQTEKKYNDVGNFNPDVITEEENDELLTLKDYNNFIKFIEPNLNKILFSRKVILVEGANDILVYKYLIEKYVENLTNDKKYAETYLNFLNMAIIVHQGKATAWVLILLCKHFRLDYFAINDLDFDDSLLVSKLSIFQTEQELKNLSIYVSQQDDALESAKTKRGKLTTN
jgi:putative ATP-dependent endonuclease of the OLD family